MYQHAPSGYDCPFCAIVAGRDALPPYAQQSDVVLRADGATAFVSYRWWPHNAGHVLVVPDTHVEDLYDLAPALAAPVHWLAVDARWRTLQHRGHVAACLNGALARVGTPRRPENAG